MKRASCSPAPLQSKTHHHSPKQGREERFLVDELPGDDAELARSAGILGGACVPGMNRIAGDIPREEPLDELS
jgi:hypothetical protein